MKRPMERPKLLITAAVMILAALCTGAFGVMCYYARVQSAIDAYVVEELNTQVNTQVKDMERVIEIQVRMLQTVANFVEVHGDDSDSVLEEEILKSLMEIEEFRRVAIVHEDGVSHYFDKDRIGTQDVNDREYYKKVKATGQWDLSDPIVSTVDGEACIVISVPVIRNDQVVSVITGSYSLERFTELTLSNSRNRDMAAYVMDSEGNLLVGYRLDSRMIIGQTNLFQFYSQDFEFLRGTSYEQFKEDITNRRAGYVITRNQQSRRYVVYAPMPYNDWNIVYIVPQSVVEGKYQFIHDYTAMLAAFLFISCAVVILLIIYVYRGVLKKIREQNDKIRRSEELYRILEENSNEVFFEYDISRQLYTARQENHPLFRSGLKLSREDSEKGILPEDLPVYREYMNAIEEGQPLYDGEFRMKRSEDAYYRWYRIHPVDVSDQQVPRTRIIGKLVDITNQKVRMEELTKKSQVDFLTDVYNRESMVSFVNSHIREDGQASHAFLLFDLDKFKEINDTYGHDAGDQVLIEFARFLKTFFRKNDYVGRIGGDEFMVLMVNAGGSRQVARRLEAFITAFEEHRNQSQYPLAGCSIGAALYPEEGASFEALYKQADQAMYKAKKSGAICNIRMARDLQHQTSDSR